MAARGFLVTALLCVALVNQCQGVLNETMYPQRSIEKGMAPLYTMTNFFLDLVQPTTNDGKDLADIIDLDTILEDKALSDAGAEIQGVLQSNWQEVLKTHIGYAACAGVGVAMMVIMTLAGLIFCCCRSCCKKKRSRVEKKNDKCKRICCGIFLAIFNTLILAGMVCAFVTNELLREQTAQDSEHALLPKVSSALQTYNTYLTNTAGEVEKALTTDLAAPLDELVAELRGLAAMAVSSAPTKLKAMSLALEAESLNDDVPDMNTDLTNLASSSIISELQSHQAEIDMFKASVTDKVSDCGTSECLRVREIVNPLETIERKVLSGFTAARDVTNSYDSNLVADFYTQAIAELKAVVEEIAAYANDSLPDVIQKASAEVEKAKEEAHKHSDDITKALTQFQMNDTNTIQQEYGEDVNKYGNYRYYIGIALSCLLLLIVLFNYLGLCFGACGEAPGEDATGCNRGVGATVLMVGVAFCFIFYWLLMAIIIALFLTGGVTYTEVCRPLFEKSDSGVIKLADAILESEYDYKYGIQQVLEDCENNMAAYSAFHLDKYINLTEVINFDDVINIEEALSSITIDTSGMELMSDGVKAQFETLKSAGLDNIDYEDLLHWASLYPLSMNLDTFTDEVEDAIADITDTTAREQLSDIVNDFVTSTTEWLIAYTAAAESFTADLSQLQATVASHNGSGSFASSIDSLISDLEQEEIKLQQDGSAYFSDFINDWPIFDDIDTFGDDLINTFTQIGRCGPLYQAFESTFGDAFCTDLLNPYNGFWFSFGWCLFFFIPSIILAVCLVDLYRKSELYYDGDHKSYDDPNYDAYAGVYPGDNIPLEDRRKYRFPSSTDGKSRRGMNSATRRNGHAVEGIRNPGYDRNGYHYKTPAASQAYPMTQQPTRIPRAQPSSAQSMERNRALMGSRSVFQASSHSYEQQPSYPQGFSASMSHNPPHYNNHSRMY